MSASCVVPREHVLDLLDDLREVLPPEMDEARRVLAQPRRAAGRGHANLPREPAARPKMPRRRSAIRPERRPMQSCADARHQAAGGRARSRGRGVPDSRGGPGRACATRVGDHRAPDVHSDGCGAAADVREADALRGCHAGAGGRAGTRSLLRADAEGYAERTLRDLVAVLRQAVATAEQGRRALATRRSESGQRPPTGAEWQAGEPDAAGRARA